MQDLLQTPSRAFPGYLIHLITSRRRLWAIGLGALAAPVIASSVFAGELPNRYVDLSPAVTQAALVSAVDTSQEIGVMLTLPLGDAEGARQFVQRVSSPKDPLFRKYITLQEFADRFGGNEADYAALREWATSNGLRISQESVARTSLTVRGTVAQFQTLFKTQLNTYRSKDGQEFYSASVRPTIPNAIASKIAGVLGLTNSIQHAEHAKIYKVLGENPETPANRTDTAGGTGPMGTYAAKDLRTAYSIPSYGGLVPQTVAVFEQGGFVHSDIEKYLTTNKLPNVPVTIIPVDGSRTYPNQATVEVVLDIDMVIAINPHVKEVLVYDDSYFNDSFPVALVDAFEQVASDHKAQTLSVSYGVDEVQQGNAAMAAEYVALEELQSVGITVFVSAGDDGAYGRTGTLSSPAKLNAPDPGSQPLVTCVGGTTLYTGADEHYYGEDVWNDLGIGDGATGGGISSVWLIPFYQIPAYVDNNGGSSTYRNVPDVAAVGNPLTGVGIYVKAAGGWLQIGGTSVSAPIWGGYNSVVNSGLGYITNENGTFYQIGFLNPLLYSVNDFNPSNWLFAILDGSNGNVQLYGTPGFNAGLGYNNCAGSGSLWGAALADQLLTAESGGTPPAAVTGLKASVTDTSVKLSWKPSSGATGYVVALYFLVDGEQFISYDGAQSFVTKETSIEVKNLTATPSGSGEGYGVVVYAVNQGGATSSSTTFVVQ